MVRVPKTEDAGHVKWTDLSGPVKPVIGFTMTVGYSDAIHGSIDGRVDQLVWKSPQEDLADSRPNHFANLRISLDDYNGSPHGDSESFTEPLFLGLVVLEGIVVLPLSEGIEDQGHGRLPNT